MKKTYTVFYYAIILTAFSMTIPINADTPSGGGVVEAVVGDARPDYELMKTMNAADATSLQFEKLMSALSAHAKKRNMPTEHASYAGIYFDDLYENGSRELKKTLAMMTYKLGAMLDTTYFSGTSKDVAVKMLLRDAFLQIRGQLTDPAQVTKAAELYKHLKAATTPAMTGVKDRLRAMPWGRVALGGALAGGAWYAYENDLMQRSSKAIGATADLIEHITDSSREAQRQTLAFYETIQEDPKGHHLLNKKERSSGKKVYFTKWDTKHRRYLYLQKPAGRQFNIHDIYQDADETNPSRRFKDMSPFYQYYHEKKVDPVTGQQTDELKNWVPAPEGLGERAIATIEHLLPLVDQVTHQVRTGVDQQLEWYEGHHIKIDKKSGRRRMVRVFVGSQGKDLHNPYNWEMRYVAEQGHAKDSDLVAGYKKRSMLSPESDVIPRLWKNDIEGDDDEGNYHETFLPERNVLEQLINTLNRANRRDSVTGAFLSTLTAQLERSDGEVQNWFENIENIDHQTARFDTDGKRYYLGLRPNGTPLSREEYDALPRTRDPEDGRETTELAYYDSYFDKENVQDKDRHTKLFKHYPETSILEKLTDTIASLEKSDSVAGGLVKVLTDLMSRSFVDDARWRFKHGFTSDRKNPNSYIKGAQRRLDKKGLPFWAIFNSDGTEKSGTRVYEDRGINGLWAALDALSSNKDSELTGLVGALNNAMRGEVTELHKLVSSVLGAPNADLFVRRILGDVSVPFVSLPTVAPSELNSVPQVQRLMATAIAERERLKKARIPVKKVGTTDYIPYWWYRIGNNKEKMEIKRGADRKAAQLAGEIAELDKQIASYRFRLKELAKRTNPEGAVESPPSPSS